MTNEDLAAKVYAGEHEAKGLLYDQVYRLIYRYAVRFYTLHTERCVSCGVEIMDMLTEGYFAMLEAVKAYCESDSGYRFNTFLSYPLKNHLFHLIGYDTKKGFHEPLNDCDSLDQPLPEMDDTTIGDTIEDENADFSDNVLKQITLSGVFGAVQNALQDIPKAYDILYCEHIKGMSRAKIAVKMGISESEVRKIEGNAMRILRHPKNGIAPVYRDEIINTSLHMSGLGYFRNAGESSVEWAVRKLTERNT